MRWSETAPQRAYFAGVSRVPVMPWKVPLVWTLNSEMRIRKRVSGAIPAAMLSFKVLREDPKPDGLAWY